MADQLPNKIPHYTRNKDREETKNEGEPILLWEHDTLPAEVWVQIDVGTTHATWTNHFEVTLLYAEKEYIGNEEEAYGEYGRMKREATKRVRTLANEFESEGEAKQWARQWMYDNPNPDPTYYRNYFVCQECGSTDVETIELDDTYLLLCNSCDQDGKAVPDSFDYEIKDAEVIEGDFEFKEIIEE